MNFSDYIMPELLLLIPILYAIGIWIKSSQIKNWLIPFILMAIGVGLTFLYVLGWRIEEIPQNPAAYVFTSITQGILVAAAAVLANNIVTQVTVGKANDKEGTKVQ